ncbi:MAG: hypothetical protein BWY83_01190 [bacterium ADurb.Bin478]|nr:MAG: hypothetical protein BWY83_01190 [bacterium ADurb.Bin478]
MIVVDFIVLTFIDDAVAVVIFAVVRQTRTFQERIAKVAGRRLAFYAPGLPAVPHIGDIVDLVKISQICAVAADVDIAIHSDNRLVNPFAVVGYVIEREQDILCQPGIPLIIAHFDGHAQATPAVRPGPSIRLIRARQIFRIVFKLVVFMVVHGIIGFLVRTNIIAVFAVPFAGAGTRIKIIHARHTPVSRVGLRRPISGPGFFAMTHGKPLHLVQHADIENAVGVEIFDGLQFAVPFTRVMGVGNAVFAYILGYTAHVPIH